VAATVEAFPLLRPASDSLPFTQAVAPGPLHAMLCHLGLSILRLQYVLRICEA
jgi:hypothetical protein